MTKDEFNELLDELVARFPRTLSVYDRRPLKIGIREELITALDDDPRIRAFLRRYTGTFEYLANLKVGAERIDLHGEPVGLVVADEARFARVRMGHIGKKLARKEKAVKPVSMPVVVEVPPSVEPAPAPPRRASLADLRASAQRRRAVTT